MLSSVTYHFERLKNWPHTIEKKWPCLFSARNLFRTFTEELGTASGIKTFIAKPLCLAGKIFEIEKTTRVAKVIAEAECLKDWVGGLGAITKFPGVIDSIVDGYKSRRAPQRKVLKEGNCTPYHRTHNEQFFGALVTFANFFSGLADGFKLAQRLHFLPGCLKNKAQWIHPIASGYVGAFTIYDETQIAKDDKVSLADKQYGKLRIICSIGHVLSSMIYLWDELSESEKGAYTLAAKVATTILPLAEKMATIYMKTFVWINSPRN